ncbi:hypothetical protein XJ44_04720 [Thermosipho affectus]|uniref:ABC transporter permease n=1 Tax=Thermosipho affectus TaxID=660294 RepID=A0ABX3IIR8_9BACT|nr:hypothetical protein [Thermosipho affectus]ONN27099.1 hypothetical protein XJ44_04720 [Thermosipho affectus]
MREFVILLKYLSNPHLYGKKKSSVKGNFLRQLLAYMMGAIPLGVMVFFFSKKIFVELYKVDQMAAKYMFLMWNSILSLFFVVGFIGLAMYSLSRNDEMELLLTMPISRTVLTAFQIFSATLSQLYTLSFFVFVSLSYIISVKQNILLGILQIILHIFFLIVFSSVVAVLIGGKTSKSFTRRFYMIVLLLSMFFYFFVIAMMDVDVSKLQNMAKLFIFSSKEYNFLAWSFISEKTFFYSLVSTVLLTFSFVGISRKVGFEPVQSKRKRGYKISSAGSPIKAVFKKDMKAALRYEQFLYFILYPLGFGIFMMFINRSDFLHSIFYTIPIFTFYIALETGILTFSEVSKIEVSSMYPIRFSTLMMPKIVLPLGLNFLILLLVFFISLFFAPFSVFIFLILIFSLILFFMSGVLGAYYAIKSPNVKSNNMNRIFTVSATFIIETITMGLAFGIIMPYFVIIRSENAPWWLYLIFISSIVFSVLLSFVYIKRLKKLIYQKL